MKDEAKASDSVAVGDDKLRRWSGGRSNAVPGRASRPALSRPRPVPWPPQPPSKKRRTMRPSATGVVWRRPDHNCEDMVKERGGFAWEVGGGGGGNFVLF
jgi:hypothetical protein